MRWYKWCFFKTQNSTMQNLKVLWNAKLNKKAEYSYHLHIQLKAQTTVITTMLADLLEAAVRGCLKKPPYWILRRFLPDTRSGLYTYISYRLGDVQFYMIWFLQNRFPENFPKFLKNLSLWYVASIFPTVVWFREVCSHSETEKHALQIWNLNAWW